MKKLIPTVIIMLLIAVLSANGITPSYIISAPGVASGMGAKLLCSARYVSGFSQQLAFADLVQYSSILERLDVQYNDEARTVSTSFFGMAPTTATYVEGLGCANDYAGYTQRSELNHPPLPVFTSRWPHGTRVESINPSIQSLTDALVAQDNSAGLDTRALLVVHKGNIVAESYAQGASAETPLLGWSMAKSLTSVMIGNLEYRGLLSADDTAGFPQWQNDNRRDITIKQLLTMTDGLDFSEEYNPGDDATAMLFTEASASGYALGRALAEQPGSQFNYSSGTANVLSRLYFDKTGGSLATAMQDYRTHIAVPLSFQHAVFETDASGVFVGSSYLYASARDWARLGQLMLNKGVLNGVRVVSEDWVQQSVQPNNSLNARAYGYQWWLNSDGSGAAVRWQDLPVEAYSAQGNRQQYVMVIPSADTVIVRLGWTSGAYPVSSRFAQLLQALE
ncbi:MAG: serine hydrolase [Pseudohongiella sp.]|nr:serine hydrolase [Pseudohongiella sp.]